MQVYPSVIFKTFKRKNIAIPLSLILIFWGYFSYKAINNKNESTRYTTAAVEKGTLVVSVSGSGQVTALNQVNLKPEVSGKITSIKVTNGQKVKTGELLFTIDATDYKQAVVEAETALETAQLDLEETLAPPDELTLLQSENAVTKAKQAQENAEKNIKTGYENAFSDITDVFSDLSTIITEARDVLYSCDIAKSETSVNDSDWNLSVYQSSFGASDMDSIKPFAKEAEDNYAIAKKSYDQNLADYKKIGYYSSNEAVEGLLKETATTSKSIAQAVKSEINLLDFFVNYFSDNNRRVYTRVTTYQTDLRSYYSKINSIYEKLSSDENSLVSNNQTLTDAQLTLKEKELSLADLKVGADELTIRAKKNTVKQKEQALETARENLNNCYILASLDGVIAEINIKKGDSVSSGTNAMTLISRQYIGEIALNETDVSNIKLNQKATITFDALEDLTITGKVIDVDTLGTVTQGVVEYGATISLDTEDERVKPGMTLMADIITEVKQDVLLVPTSALKKQSGVYYVQKIENSNNNTASVSESLKTSDLKSQEIQIGSANDTMTEITSGLKEGDVIVKTTQTTSSSNQSSSVSTGRGAGGEFQMMQIMR